uniref:RxLR effector candidate protein n=1 Tax=Hyaloperonospora arabidopsidis (strain Emoy2) TaxID=559515 RepID=M4BNX7_HYAAE
MTAAVEDSSTRESETRDDKILAALTSVTERLVVRESSQRVREEDERMMGAAENGMFASKLDANMRGRPMAIDPLEPPKRSSRHRAPARCALAAAAPHADARSATTAGVQAFKDRRLPDANQESTQAQHQEV